MFLEVLEDKADDEEVDGDGDAEDGKGCQDAVDTYPQEEVEETQLQEVVEDVGTCKSGAVARAGLLTEREVGGEVVVGKEADDVADGESDVEVDPVLQQPVDGVVDGYSQYTDDSEAEQLANGLFLCQIFDFHGAKVVKTERNAK